ncbi:MAG: hypothetical protein M1818_005664 [Claussenomyces sp. TS43310]|nr:MAG: hypothetical protein M1818_005664 [Claussenomyces sp. TS43310]
MVTQWRPLPIAMPVLGADTQLPPLLVCAHFAATAYTIHLTDLTHLWRESLDRRAIIKRSLDADTSIDPSEDAEQFRQLLDRIQLTLAGGPDTTLTISAAGAVTSSATPSLTLHVTAQLPGGLRPLEWSVYLAAAPPSALTMQLVLPLVRAQNARLRELESLVNTLRDKDHVIQKLVDKLEATGAELSHVFPGAAGKGRRPLARKLAEGRVKGLAPFDAETWRSDLVVGEQDGRDGLEDATDRVFGRDMRVPIEDTDLEVPQNWNQWWDQDLSFQFENSNNRKDPKTTVRKEPEVTNSAPKDSTPAEDDDFQVQATPPRDTNHQSSPPSKHRVAGHADDEDDLDQISQRSAVPDSLPLLQPSQKAKKLGTIGRSKVSSTSKPAVAATSPQSPQGMKDSGKATQAADLEATTSEEDDAAPALSAKAKTPLKQIATPPAAAPQAKKGRLGKIGGKSKEDRGSLAQSAEPREEMTLPERAQKPKYRLGVIGHKAEPVNEAETTEKNVLEHGEGKKTTTPPVEEDTAEQKADRKREELKRQLEKGKAPVKKKRKF